MRRAYYNQWSFHHGDAAIPEAHPEEQLGMAVYNIPAKVVTWTRTSESEDPSTSSGSQTKSTLKKPSKLLAILLVLFVIFLLAFASTLIAWGVLSDGFESHKGGISDDDDGGSANSQNRICVSDDCTQVAGDIVRFFDKTADPCDDFYQFVCGKYIHEVPIPRDKDKTGTMDQMEHKVKMQLRTLFEMPIAKNESSSSLLVKQFYRACMDVQTLQAQGLEPLKKAVGDLGGWPVGIDFGWNESDYAWERSNAALRSKYGVHALMIVTVDSDFRNKSRRLITIDQPDAESLNLVHAWEAARTRGKSLLHSALDGMVDLALEFGADRDSVILDMEEILLLEILLDNITLTEERRRDRFRFYHPLSLSELTVIVPEIDWKILFGFLLPRELRISEKEVIFNIVDLTYLVRLQEVLKRFSKRTLANYHIYYLTDTYIRYLAPGLRNLRRDYARRFLKTPATSSLGLARWEECVDETAALLSWRPVSEMYADRNVSGDAKSEVELMFTYLQDAASRLLRKNEWMDNSTTEAATFKLDQMAINVLDVRSLNESVEVVSEYEKLNFTNVSYFDAVVQLNSFRNRVTFLSLRHTSHNDSDDALIDFAVPASVNAYYRFDRNEVVLPIALLQYPLYSSQVPGYIRYSRLGSLAGHEIMHGYDEEGRSALGRQYDAYGNLRRWWSNSTLEQFENRIECLVEQFCNITDETSGHELNGKRTLGENLADHGGIRVAYDAYLSWKKRQKLDDEDRLPGLASFTTAQIFFLSFANVWCESIRPEARALFIDEDLHALGRYRVNVPLQNFPGFSEVFGCPLGSQMNPVKKCQVW